MLQLFCHGAELRDQGAAMGVGPSPLPAWYIGSHRAVLSCNAKFIRFYLVCQCTAVDKEHTRIHSAEHERLGHELSASAVEPQPLRAASALVCADLRGW